MSTDEQFIDAIFADETSEETTEAAASGELSSLEDFTLQQAPPSRYLWIEGIHHTVAIHLSILLSGRVKHEPTGMRTGLWRVWDGSRWSARNAEAQVVAAYQRFVSGTDAVDQRVYPTKRIVVYRTVKLTPQSGAARVASGELLPDPAGNGGFVYAKNGKPCTTERVEDNKWSGSTANMDAVIRQLRTKWNTQLQDGEAWDADAHLLNTPTGTLDLRDMTIRPARSLDLITKQTGACFYEDEEPEAPRFRQFMEEILPDKELREYTQRVLGSSLFGEVAEQIIVALVGHRGRNGKSALLEIVKHAMGDYAGDLPGQVLVERRGESHPTELMVLEGARLVTTSETKAGQRWNTNLLKTLTGGDTITARGMHQDFRTFRPSHQLVIATNHRPSVSPGESAFWKRYREIPFSQVFVGEAADPRLVQTIVKNELDGVLLWLIEGYRDYRDNGLQDPEAVIAASREAAASASTFAVFVRECFVAEAGATITAGEAYTAWRNYRKRETDNERERPTRSSEIGRAVQEELTDAGYEVTYERKQGGNRPARFVGIRLADEAMELLKSADPFGIS